jgi:LDH2 family malate/lactate/ureidoglycolate dehydrogenase
MRFGHKGYGLGMMVEMLVGPLSHAGCTTSASGTGGGVMILAININDFIDLASYEDEVEALAEWVCSARPLPGFDKIYTPGDLEQESYARLCVEGIDLPEPTWKAIGEIAGELDVAMPVL